MYHLRFQNVQYHFVFESAGSGVLQSRSGRRVARLRDRPGVTPEKVVIDRGCRIPEGTIIGEDPELDAQRFYRSPNGVVLVTQEMFARLYNFEHIPKVE